MNPARRAQFAPSAPEARASAVLRRATRRHPNHSRTAPSSVDPYTGADAERASILALVDELAVLAAELWFEGRLGDGRTEEETRDAEDDEDDASRE